MDITISLITTLVLTLINGYFSMSEMALTTAKRAVLEHDAEEGDKRAERAVQLALCQFLCRIFYLVYRPANTVGNIKAKHMASKMLKAIIKIIVTIADVCACYPRPPPYAMHFLLLHRLYPEAYSPSDPEAEYNRFS